MLFINYILLTNFIDLTLSLPLQTVKQVIYQAQKNIWKQIQPNKQIWNFPYNVGTQLISYYHFHLKALSYYQNSKFNPGYFKEKLLKSQKSDGSWQQTLDLNNPLGSLDTTILNYWFLKDIGLSENSPVLLKGKQFILSHGGIQASKAITKYQLAIFGMIPWNSLTYFPLFMFKNYWPFRIFYLKSINKPIVDYITAQIYSYLTAISYMMYHKSQFFVSQVCLNQLKLNKSQIYCRTKAYQQQKYQKLIPEWEVINLINQILGFYDKIGGFGPYTIATLFNTLALQDYNKRYSLNSQKKYLHLEYDQKNGNQYNKLKSLKYLDQLFFNFKQPYEGVLLDRRYSDTVLCALALLESEQKHQKVISILDYLSQNAFQEDGGFMQGPQFQNYINLKQMGLSLMLFSHFKQKYNKQIIKIIKYISSHQAISGGFSTYQLKNQNYILDFIIYLNDFTTSAIYFDQQNPQALGNILQGFGAVNVLPEELIYNSIKYLKKNQNKQSQWKGRWGINYISSLATVIPGLKKIGFNMTQDWIKKSIQFIIQNQQSNGGFGQNQLSFKKGFYMKGFSTVTMTSWALLALLEVKDLFQFVNTPIQKAVQYILQNFKKYEGNFCDESVVASHYPSILNIQSKIYSLTYPLIALGRYVKVQEGRYQNKKIFFNSQEPVTEL